VSKINKSWALAAGLAEGGGGATEVRGHRSGEGGGGATQWPVAAWPGGLRHIGLWRGTVACGRREGGAEVSGGRRTCAGRRTVVGGRLRRAAVWESSMRWLKRGGLHAR
jgi:hypothetical protein